MDQLLDSSGYTDALQLTEGSRPPACPASTCRFDTRIDYILLRSDAERPSSEVAGCKVSMCFEKDSYSVVDTMHITDHNLVTSSIVLTTSRGRTPPREMELV